MATGAAGDIASVVDVQPLFDANLFCGSYPFRKLPGQSAESLAEVIAAARLSRCVLTPFESIFYRQPLEGLKPWLDAACTLPFKPLYWLAVNPLMPAWQRDLEAARRFSAVAGIRLFPRYHGYGLDHPALAEVAAAASSLLMPINLTARLLDDRLHPYPLRADDPLAMETVVELLQRSSQAPWVLSMFTMAELAVAAPMLSQNPNLYFDIGCSKPFEFWEDDIRALGAPSQIIYGTGAPLYYHLGNRISLSRSGFTATEKQAIFTGNLERMVSIDRRVAAAPV